MNTTQTTTAHTRRHPADRLETGNLLRTQPRALARAPETNAGPVVERHEVILMGAGQAGLSVGYHLKRRGIDDVILDAAARRTGRSARRDVYRSRAAFGR